jgi:hypothetical protein
MDVDRDRVRIRLLVDAIQLLLQHRFGDDTPEAPHHLLEDRQLSAGQAGGVPADRQLSSDRIETNVAGLECHSQHGTWTAQERLDPGHKLGHSERFGQIIVGSGIQPRHPVLDRVPRRQDQDRESFSGGARDGQHGNTVTIGQTKIEDRRIIVDQHQRRAGIASRGGNVDSKADLAELGFQNTGEAVFIFDD